MLEDFAGGVGVCSKAGDGEFSTGVASFGEGQQGWRGEGSLKAMTCYTLTATKSEKGAKLQPDVRDV